MKQRNYYQVECGTDFHETDRSLAQEVPFVAEWLDQHGLLWCVVSFDVWLDATDSVPTACSLRVQGPIGLLTSEEPEWLCGLQESLNAAFNGTFPVSVVDYLDATTYADKFGGGYPVWICPPPRWPEVWEEPPGFSVEGLTLSDKEKAAGILGYIVPTSAEAASAIAMLDLRSVSG